MKKFYFIMISLLLLTIISINGIRQICYSNNQNETVYKNIMNISNREYIYKTSSNDIMEIDESIGDAFSVFEGSYLFENRRYFAFNENNRGEIEIYYPQIIIPNDSIQQKKINTLMKIVLYNEIINDSISRVEGLCFNVSYTITYCDNQFVSILFFGNRYSDLASYQVSYIETTNIYLKYPVDKLRLRDFYIIDNDFIDTMIEKAVFNNDKYMLSESTFEYLIRSNARGEYGYEQLTDYLFGADGENSRINTYYCIDRVGITMTVGNVMGGIMHFELMYEDLIDYARTDNKIFTQMLVEIGLIES